MTEPNSKEILVTFSMAVILITHVFLFIPFTLYLSNADEFVTPVWNILQLCFIPALVVLLLLYILGRFFRGEMHRRYTVFLAAIGLLIWFQGNVLIWDYGILDGRTIDWSKDVWRGWLDLGLWFGVISCAFIFYRQIGKIVVHIACAVFVIQLLTAIYSGIENSSKLGTQETKIPSSNSALQELYKFSPENNVVHLVLDGFQSDVFEELMEHELLGKKYRSDFSGFVFYNETLGTFPYTRFAVPAFLSGEIYTNNVPKNDFITSVIKGKTILNTANEFGYVVDLASEPYFGALYANGTHANSYIIPKDSATDFKSDNATMMLDLTLFRIAPHFVKKYVYNDQSWLLNSKFSGKEHMQYRYFSHTAFVNELTENMSIERTSPVYKYIHVMNVHNPMVVAPNCGYAGRTMGTTRITLTVQSKCTLDTIVKLFNKMKALGIYDNALIVMHADHGGWTVPYRWKQRIFWSNGEEITPFAASLASPLLAIKPPGVASGELKISPALASLTDIPDTISTIMKWGIGFGGKSILDLDPKTQRERKFYFYTWQRDAWETDYTGPIQEFIIKGSHYDTPWLASRMLLPPSDK